jgi:spermidine synthase
MARPQPQPAKKAARKASDDQQVERLHKGYAQAMEITKVLVDEQSKFQHIKIFDTVANGRVMTLDDIVQITSRDESAYADMLTHLPMLEHGKVERVMIVGGGDLSIADEALKHKNVKEVVLVDIDAQVIQRCKETFGEINGKAFKDKRMTIEAADAFEYLGRKSSKNRFDLIIADRPDPVGPGKALFGETFYDRIKGALKPGGYATFQTGVPFYQPWEVTEAIQELKRFFPTCGVYLTVVPTYFGGFLALTWATKGGKQLGTPAGIKKAAAAYKKSKLKCDYYNPGIHAAAFALPNWIAKLVP